MATFERSLTLNESPEAALQTCARALTIAGLKDVETNQPAMVVTGRKCSAGQWTKDQVTITIKAAPEGRAEVTVLGQATAQRPGVNRVEPREADGERGHRCTGHSSGAVAGGIR